MKIIMDRVYVLWIDSESPVDGGWQLPSTMDDLTDHVATVETVGFLYKETDDLITVVSSIASSPCFQGIMIIPKVAIKEMIKYDEFMKPKTETKNGKNES